MILEALCIDDIRTRCPRFNEWMTKLEEGIRNDYFKAIFHLYGRK